MTVQQIETQITRLKKKRDKILCRPGLGGYLLMEEERELENVWHKLARLQQKLQVKTTPQTTGEHFEEGKDLPV